MRRYTIRNFRRAFPNDAACLEWLKDKRWPDGIFCKKCERVTKHHRVRSRPSYECGFCGNHVHPTANTIFHKSRTPLTTWFHVIYLMAQTRGGISAKQVERETGVTYKTAWRMCNLIRSSLAEGLNPFTGTVEVDETYVGGRRPGKHGRGAKGKTIVLGMAQRKGRLQTQVIANIRARAVIPVIRQHVKPGSTIYTDELNTYNRLKKFGYEHDRVLHSAKVYVEGDVHTNAIEGFWSLVKRGIAGVFHQVGPHYLQHYVNEYAFRYNHRDDETPMFLSFLGQTSQTLVG